MKIRVAPWQADRDETNRHFLQICVVDIGVCSWRMSLTDDNIV